MVDNVFNNEDFTFEDDNHVNTFRDYDDVDVNVCVILKIWVDDFYGIEEENNDDNKEDENLINKLSQDEKNVSFYVVHFYNKVDDMVTCIEHNYLGKKKGGKKIKLTGW